MAIDTRDKRSSAVYVGMPWRGMLPAPDNTIDQVDRQQIALMYSGILAASPAVVLYSPIARLAFADVAVSTLTFSDVAVARLAFADVTIADMDIDYG